MPRITVTPGQLEGVRRFIRAAGELEALSNHELGCALLNEVWTKLAFGSREELILSEAISRLAPELDKPTESNMGNGYPYSHPDCPFNYCDSPNDECRTTGQCHHRLKP